MEKLINKNGEVAVLYSPEYGAGWVTWNVRYPQMVFEREMVEAVLESERLCLGDEAKIEKLLPVAERLFPGAYLGGINGLRVGWVRQGSVFKISELDGFEAIEYLGFDAFCA